MKKTTVKIWKPATQERFSNAHATYLKEALNAELLPVLHVQRGNAKTGAIPCINMPMLITCPAAFLAAHIVMSARNAATKIS
jgi:hypothetical protein